MNELMQIYSPDGEIFEVRPDKARELVIAHGWSLGAPGETQKITEAIEHIPSESIHHQGPVPVNITDSTG